MDLLTYLDAAVMQNEQTNIATIGVTSQYVVRPVVTKKINTHPYSLL